MHPLSLDLAGQNRQLDPRRPWTVGSSQYADVRIDHPGVQDIHLILRWSGSSWTIEDRGSETGTAFNGFRLHSHMAALLESPAQIILAPDTGRGLLIAMTPQRPGAPAPGPGPSGAEASGSTTTAAGAPSAGAGAAQASGQRPATGTTPAPGRRIDPHSEDIPLASAEPTVFALPVEHAAQDRPSAEAQSQARESSTPSLEDIHSAEIPEASAEPTVFAVSMNRELAPQRDDGPDAEEASGAAPAVQIEQRSWVNRPEAAEILRAPEEEAQLRSGMRLSPAFRAREIGGTLTIGRDPSADVLIDGLLVSRRHAQLTRTERGAMLTDLGSTNGTWVNGQRISGTVELLPGAQAVIGGVPFRQTEVGLAEVVRTEGNTSIMVQDLTYTVPDRKNPRQRKTLVDDITLEIPDRSLIAVIGPSGAGKSTFLNCMLGDVNPDEGRIEYHGLDMAQFGSALSSQIGMVPQEDVLHRELTAQQVLESTAALRLPEDVDRASRKARIASVLEALGLTEHARTPVSQLSGGQRKRVSTAMELLTGPRYLFLDEPTSGLDPDMDFEVMDLLRRMAHGEVGGADGSTVVVITHSTANLDLADRVLVLAPGGSVAYFGEPAGMMPYFQRSQGLGPQVREVYKGLKDDPASAAAAFRHENDDDAPRERVHAQTPTAAPHASSRRGLFQLSVLLRRQIQLMRTDALSVLITTVLAPALLALLVLVVPGDHGLTMPSSTDSEVNQPQILLIVILLAAVALGLFPACRTFLDEKRIFLREARTGLGVWPYVGAKALMTITTSLVQSLILVLAVLALIPHEPMGAWGPMWLELWIVTFLLTMTSWLLGFMVSAMVSRADVAMNVASLLVVVQLIFCGGLFAMDGATDGISRAVPTRWAYAAMGQTGDLNEIVRVAAVTLPQEEANAELQDEHDQAAQEARDAGAPEPPAPQLPEVDDSSAVLDPLWKRATANWWGSTGITAGFGIAFLLISVLLIRRTKRRKR
ncbi:ATP-binding cassette domain-containing protein [Kocuria sp. p3-SID1433]|uniref:ATP-binding cassette domain-containing protein n=1 Tax=unclassified Kocuria TaxID=2649579 RepID=UPI0021A84E43|nr:MULTISPECIES: ATP-binding cassette domain-containing protein [unclassified Kocuria]MCT1602236.1 ATP-binding cassette domain-containing protein [Kocuria sp. p3-SID1428]MCT2180482.1 ATP-binding cassette domain-containing protein [Kocuria sp. p3-SID1433]